MTTETRTLWAPTFGALLLELSTEWAGRRCLLVVDEGVQQLYAEKLKKWFPRITTFILPSGEQHKHLGTVEVLWRQFMEAGMERKDVVCCMGGGMTTDLAGFAAACWKRGVSFVFVPTTLLAMVDASTGGKLGVDFMGGKNLIGVFQEPRAVAIATEFLQTLPDRELRAGYAEMLKHALIADASQWQELKAHPYPYMRQSEALELIKRSLAIKQRVVYEDPREAGLRKTLNFGHTIGHAIESVMLETEAPLLHGEAVAMGLWLECWLSAQLCGLDPGIVTEVETVLRENGFPLSLPHGFDQELFVRYLLQDKKNEGGKVQACLLKQLGEAVPVVPIPVPLALESLTLALGGRA